MPPSTREPEPQPWRGELWRALGAALVTPPPNNAAVLDALGLPAQTGADHTGAFVLSAPPHAAIHLGPDGKLGGAGLDRVAGFWRVLGLDPPEDADHLGVLLMLYAELGDAEHATTTPDTRRALTHARTTLFAEHIASWAPSYLAAVTRHTPASVAAWATLTADAVRTETAPSPSRSLPAALRDAPDPIDPTADDSAALLDALLSPVRSGLVLTWPDVEQCGAQAGLGVRRGERRYAIKAYLEQDPRPTLHWLAHHARACSQQHAAAFADPDVAQWWQARARHTAAALESMLEHTTVGVS